MTLTECKNAGYKKVRQRSPRRAHLPLHRGGGVSSCACRPPDRICQFHGDPQEFFKLQADHAATLKELAALRKKAQALLDSIQFAREANPGDSESEWVQPFRLFGGRAQALRTLLAKSAAERVKRLNSYCQGDDVPVLR